MHAIPCNAVTNIAGTGDLELFFEVAVHLEPAQNSGSRIYSTSGEQQLLVFFIFKLSYIRIFKKNESGSRGQDTN